MPPVKSVAEYKCLLQGGGQMSCSCKHLQKEISESMDTLKDFRELFIKRMTVDSEIRDRRRKDYNQAIFYWNDYWKEYCQVYNNTSMEMVLKCFDNAIKDYRRTFCDTEGCKRK